MELFERAGNRMGKGDDQSRPRKKGVSRRRFLSLAASAAGASLLEAAQGAGREPKLRMPLGRPPSRVVTVRSSHVVAGLAVHGDLLAEMLEGAVAGAMQTKTASDGWQVLLKADDVIGLKFNRSGQERLGTTTAMAEVLVESIVAAGFSPSQIVCIEAPPGTEERHGTVLPRSGYARSPTDFGSGQDQLASVLSQVTALIDIPYLKAHRLAGMTCALKNLSHGLIKHPARYHGNGCSPYIADIVALSEIRAKLRLCLVDALRVVYDISPESPAGSISPEGVILASLDPVAVDAVGFGVLNDVRRRHGVAPVGRFPEDVGYLAAAHRRNLGVAVLHGVDVVHVEP